MPESVFADYLVHGGLDLGSIDRTQHADGNLEPGGIDSEDFVGGQDEKSLSRDFDQRRHDFNRMRIGAQRNDDGCPGSA